MSVETTVLRMIMPSKDEQKKISKIVSELTEKTLAAIKKYRLIASPLLVGSVAKGTYLKNTDIDIFIAFPITTPKEELERRGLQIGRSVVDGEERYAEHPYIHGKFKGYTVDIVPCYQIKEISQKMTAVDRTPFHTSYVIEHMNDEKKNDVRILKQFLKGVGIYGAEAEVQGFSGYLCELLILRYGSLNNLMKNAVKWKIGEAISLDNNTTKRFEEPFIFIDPVDKNRNVASALSLLNFSKFIHACDRYMAANDATKLKFFFPNEVKAYTPTKIVREMEKRGTTFVAISFKKPNLVNDVLYPQLRKFERGITKSCAEVDFSVINSNFCVSADKVIFVFEFEVSNLPVIKKHRGPFVWHPRSRDFLNKWKISTLAITGPYVENGYWVVDIKRRYTKARDFLREQLPNLSLGKDINKIIAAKNFRVLENEEILSLKCNEFLMCFLSKKFSWEI
ncbi:MAG: CCA tRNA nucleotidyltransferase [Thermoplasmata archaeon]